MDTKKPSDNNKIRRLPLSGTTKDAEEYLEAWEKLARPLCRAFGWEIMGFDPGYIFDTDGRHSITLPSKVIIQISEVCTRAEKAEAELAARVLAETDKEEE